MVKHIKVALILCLGGYPILELSRFIVTNAFVLKLYPTTPSWWFVFELFFMWAFYLSIPIVYYKVKE